MSELAVFIGHQLGQTGDNHKVLVQPQKNRLNLRIRKKGKA